MTIRIEALTFETIIGILDFERQTPQRVVVDCTIEYEGEYVDYAIAREIIMHTIRKGAYGLIEEAIPAVTQELHNTFSQISAILLRITKPDIFDDCRVSVENRSTF